MPIGVIVNVLSVVIGGLLGAAVREHLSDRLKDGLTLVFSVCALGIGISAVIQMKNMPAVILATVVGTAIGIAIHLGDSIQKGALKMEKGMRLLMSGKRETVGKKVDNVRDIDKVKTEGSVGGGLNADATALLVTAMVLFCSSGTGIYGTIVSGVEGDHSILLAKSVLDLFTALIFACKLGAVVSAIAIPQTIIFLILFYCSTLISPLISPTMMADFKACGGLVLLATGLRMAKIKDYPIADMIPAMIIVLPVSWLWVTYVVPLIASLG